jgi:hypothetical protein
MGDRRPKAKNLRLRCRGGRSRALVSRRTITGAVGGATAGGFARGLTVMHATALLV